VLCGKEEYPERIEEVQNEKERHIKAAERWRGSTNANLD
jgi:hypothetical protein